MIGVPTDEKKPTIPTVFITIDTEEDLWGVFQAENNPVENVSEVPAVQRIFDRFGAIPTYLVNWPVVSDRKAVTVIRRIADDGRCEVGTHCHPWNTPPYEEELGAVNSMLSNLPPSLVWRKLESLHSRIADRMGRAPVSFRAGRWGFNEPVAACLERLDYAVDTSVSPTMNWSGDGGPDFTDSIHVPYRFSAANTRKSDPAGKLLEVPATIGFWQPDHRKQVRRFQKVRRLPRRLRLLGVLDRVGLLNHRWLSPEQSTAADMIRLARGAVRDGNTSLNMCFHSNSLLPGITPFVRDSAQLKEFLGRIQTFLEFAASSGFTFAPLSRAPQQLA